MIKFVVLLLVLNSVYSLYEDQIGIFDWRQQYIGKVTRLFWEQSSGGKKLFVATEKNLIASLNAANGHIIWRRVFEEGRRGEVDDMIYSGDLLVTGLNGKHFQGWAPGTGSLVWDVYLEGDAHHKAIIKFAEDKKLVIALTSEKVYGLRTRDGHKEWEVQLLDSSTVSYKKLLVHEGALLIIGMTTGFEVKVVSIDLLDGTTFFTKSFPAGFLRRDTSCEIVQEKYLMCYCPASESFHVMELLSPNGFVSTSVQELGLRLESVLVSGWENRFTTASSGMLVQFAPDHFALVIIGENGHISLKKDLPQVDAATVVKFDGQEYLFSLKKSMQEAECVFVGYNLTSNEPLSDISLNIHYAAHNGQPLQVSVLLAKRPKDGKLACKVAILSQDYSLQLSQKTGKVVWRREEALAYVAAVEMVDLPVSENQAKFEDEFGSHHDSVLTMFLKRLKTQLSQLQTFIVHQLHKLQGVKHHSSVTDDAEEEGDEEELLRDDFNLHKMIVLVTAPGKIIGMKSSDGHVVWQHFIPELSAFDGFRQDKFVLYIQRTTSHFPHPPQCVVLGKNRVSGRGHLYTFNPISGLPVDKMTTNGFHLPYGVKQAFLFGVWDEHFMKPLILMDDQDMIHTYPTSLQSHVRNHGSTLYIYLADTHSQIVSGYRFVKNENTVTADKVWSINLQNQYYNVKITNIVRKSETEHIHSQGRVLGDRSVLYKYLNPNVVVITTEGEEPATLQQKAYAFINVYIVDTITGHIIFHCNHRNSEGPVHVVHSENWVVYNYFNSKNRRHEIASLEMFDGKQQSNITVFSSFSSPTKPLVMRQSFIFPHVMYTMTTTITEKGIAAKDILVALTIGGICTLPKAFLDPRRPLTPTAETQEEGTFLYIPELPVSTESIINYNLTLFHVHGIHTSPTGLESTSLVLSYGLDLFHTRVQPSKMFDVLNDDFEHSVIAIVVVAMILASFITQKLAFRQTLNRQWK